MYRNTTVVIVNSNIKKKKTYAVLEYKKETEEYSENSGTKEQTTENMAAY